MMTVHGIEGVSACGEGGCSRYSGRRCGRRDGRGCGWT